MTTAKPDSAPSSTDAWRLIRDVIRTLAREDSRRGSSSFASRAIRAALLSSLAGAFGGLIPAFVAIGISGITSSSAPPTGPLSFIVTRLHGSATWLWLVVSLALVTAAVAVGFVASRSAANFSADATATLRIAMMRRVVASSARLIDTVGSEMLGPARPKGLPEPKAGAPVRAAPGSEAVKLAVLRDGQMASELIVAAISNLPQTVFGLVMLVIDVSASGSALAAAMGVGVFLFSRLFASRASARVSAATAELSRADATTFAEIGEKVSHLDDLRLAGARQEALQEVEGAIRVTADKRRLVARAVAISGQTASLVSTLAPLVVLLSLSATGQTVAPAEIARLLLALPLIIARLGAVDALRIAAIEKRPVLVSVHAIMGLASHPAAASQPVALGELQGAASVSSSPEIVFEGVGFQPPGHDKAILEDVSFRVPPGTIVGLCGPSGCGKSTLLRMLLRLDDPTSGRILVGGADLVAIDPRALPELFGALAQGGKLLGRSIGDNVALGMRPEVDHEHKRAEAKRMLEVAQIAELATEAGLDRRFSAAPANLSGGEQRRVLLARALAMNARVLVLDEPEAGLPRATARALFEAVKGCLGDRSAVVVTHAPGVLESTFNVVMERGRVVDQGPHEELLERCELYRTLTAEKASAE